MDLIYTNDKKIDQGVLKAYALDLSYGTEENNFIMTLGKSEAQLEYGAFIYIENTEYGGIIDGKKASTGGDIITYSGRTWHGILNSKVIEPPTGQDHFIISGDANDILAILIARLGLGELFTTIGKPANIPISNYKFDRYCKAYDGIRKMLSTANAKLQIRWIDRKVQLSATPAIDYSESPIDEDIAVLAVEQHAKKVNHLICLGKGELSDREVIHLYTDQFGRIRNEPYYTGLDEMTDIYENTGAESSDELRNEGIEHLNELRDNDTSEIAITETVEFMYDIDDIVGAAIVSYGISTSSKVTQKIIKINNGIVNTEYKVGS